MHVLKRAHDELFRRAPDECFPSFDALARHCQEEKEKSLDRWHPPPALRPRPEGPGELLLDVGTDGAFAMNDWSFGQLCGLARVSKETPNRLSAETADRVLEETLPHGKKALQLLTKGDTIRSVLGVGCTRLHNADLLTMLREFATDFTPPQKAAQGGTGLYCGEQDMFVFMIDPTGWAEIEDQAFAPGFFIWNSEVGKRSIGVETFWFRAVCANHLVWDAVEVVEFSRKHTAKVHEAFGEMRRLIETLVQKRDERRDGFVRVMKKAMETRLGDNAEEVSKVLTQAGVQRALVKRALEIAQSQGRFTIFALVDALTRIAGEMKNAGERTDADEKASRLLALAA
jgi:hypothetical protein